MVTALVLVLVFILLVPVAIILNGWVLSTLWGWFIVPLGVTPIGIAWAIGISGVAHYLTRNLQQPDKDNTTQENGVIALVQLLVVPIVALAVGWLVQMFM